MKRIPEPELMLDEEQVLAYAQADFAEPHGRFLELLQDRVGGRLPEHGRAIDLGCGPGDVTFRFARAFPTWTIDAVDGSPTMLRWAREAVRREGLDAWVRFQELRLPDEGVGAGYDLVFSNSLLHHLADPGGLWSTVTCTGRTGSSVFLMDLVRPSSETDAARLVEKHAGSEPEILRRDFYRSLLAAWRPEEVRAQLCEADLGGLTVEAVTDRHLIVWGRLPFGVTRP